MWPEGIINNGYNLQVIEKGEVALPALVNEFIRLSEADDNTTASETHSVANDR